MHRTAALGSLTLVVLLCFATTAPAGQRRRPVAERNAPSAEPATLMCERGKLLLSTDFDKPLDKPWRALKGKWEVNDGAIQGAELESDHHGAVIRANVPFHNAVIQYTFKLDGARATSFSINDAKGHNSRVMINAAGFSARKDDHDHEGPDKAALLQTIRTPIRPGEWHTVIIEVNGPEFLARLDGKQVAYGRHEAIDVDKTNVGLTVGGESASFKLLRIWDATQKNDWTAPKVKPLSARQRR